MNKKFILLLALLSIIFSCRESEEIMENEKTNVNRVTEFIKKTGNENKVLSGKLAATETSKIAAGGHCAATSATCGRTAGGTILYGSWYESASPK